MQTRAKRDKIPRHWPDVIGERVKRIKLIPDQIASPIEARTIVKLGINHNVAVEMQIHAIIMAPVAIFRV